MRFIRILNTKTASAICLLISIACRAVNINFASFIGRDKMILMQQSRNLLEGRGLSITKYFIQNTDSPLYDPTPFWPPGYPVLLAPFLKFFNYDIYRATIVVDIIGGIALIFIVRKIAKELRLPLAAVNIITLIVGCFEYAFIYESMPTDIPAFVFFLTGFLFLLQAVQKENYSFINLIFISFLFFLPCTFRYSYPPLGIAALLALVFYGWYIKKNMLIKKGLVCLGFFSVMLTAFLLLLKIISGSASYIVDSGKGFFPEYVIHSTPFIPESFINAPFTKSQLLNKTNISPADSLLILEIINNVLLIGLVVLFIYLFFKQKFFRSPDSFKWFLLSGFFISAATYVCLAYLTLIYKPQLGFGIGWTYLGEPRYFMFVNFFLQISFISWIFLYPSWKRNLFQKIIVAVFSFLLFVEVTHNIYFHTKVMLRPSKYNVAAFEEPDYMYCIDMLKSLHHDNPDADLLVVADNDDFFPLAAGYLGQKGIYDGYNMLKKLPRVKKQTIIIIALYDQEITGYQQFLTANNATLLNHINSVSFYRLNLSP